MEDNKFVLEVSDLHTTFKTDNGDVSAVNGVSFKLEPGKTLGIVGESGSGKSVTAYSIMQILAENGAITGGSVKYKGEDILKAATDFVRLNELSKQKEEASAKLEEKMERWMYLEEKAARIEAGELEENTENE